MRLPISSSAFLEISKKNSKSILFPSLSNKVAKSYCAFLIHFLIFLREVEPGEALLWLYLWHILKRCFVVCVILKGVLLYVLSRIFID